MRHGELRCDVGCDRITRVGDSKILGLSMMQWCWWWFDGNSLEFIISIDMPLGVSKGTIVKLYYSQFYKSLYIA